MYARSLHSASRDTSDTAQLTQTLTSQVQLAPSPGLTHAELQQSEVRTYVCTYVVSQDQDDAQAQLHVKRFENPAPSSASSASSSLAITYCCRVDTGIVSTF